MRGAPPPAIPFPLSIAAPKSVLRKKNPGTLHERRPPGTYRKMLASLPKLKPLTRSPPSRIGPAPTVRFDTPAEAQRRIPLAVVALLVEAVRAAVVGEVDEVEAVAERPARRLLHGENRRVGVLPRERVDELPRTGSGTRSARPPRPAMPAAARRRGAGNVGEPANGREPCVSPANHSGFAPRSVVRPDAASRHCELVSVEAAPQSPAPRAGRRDRPGERLSARVASDVPLGERPGRTGPARTRCR